MNEPAPEMLSVLPNPALFRAARWGQRIGVGISSLGILFGLLPLTRIDIGNNTPAAARGSIPLLLTAAICILTLLLSSWNSDGPALRFARPTANGLTLFGAAVVLFWMRVSSVGTKSSHVIFSPSRLSLGFVLLALAVVLVDRENWLLNRIADVLVSGLCFLCLMLIGALVFLGRDASLSGSGSIVVCFIALTATVTFRQAEHGIFAIFLGVGAGSRLARIFAPILVIQPFAWQAANSRLNGRLNGTVLASVGVAAAFGMLLVFAWRMSRMENEIHDLVLRDEATRLYNQRGFHMLAEHALRLAKRSAVPFSVLFINLESLRQIHAQLGSDFATASLAEAGEILRATFRESDIKGRIGSDEFAVAGRFDRTGISVAALRLEAAAATRSAKSGHPIPLRFSMGHVTTDNPETQETLKDLLVRAAHAKNRIDLQMSEMRVN